MKKNNTKSGNTKNVLMLSILLLFISIIALVGYTLAFFTDTATSGRNKITAGNLDVEIEYAKTDARRDTSGKILESEWKKVTEDASLFSSIDGTLWEPGHTEVTYLRIRNTGTLALKYDFSIQAYGDEAGAEENEYTNVNGDKVKLSKFLILNQKEGTELLTRSEYWLTEDEEQAALGQLEKESTDIVLKPGEEKTITLVVYMPSKVDNKANQLASDEEENGNPEIYFGITVVATQAQDESDSFGSDYDRLA